jgi:polyhydroxyalkanoate synthesis repressor PhaR
MKQNKEIRIIKKYQNRRLYDTATSTYIILEDIKQMIIEGETITVIDVKTGNSVTRSVLLQIILDEEVNSSPIFRDDFLLQIIRFYGKAFQPAISPFLEQGMDMLKQSQKQFVTQVRNASNGKEQLNHNLDKWKEYWESNNGNINQNMFEYLTTSTNQFLQMQLNVQEQIQNQRDNIMNLIKFPFKK